MNNEITRRAALRSMGKAGLAVLILGNACSDETSPASPPSIGPSPTPAPSASAATQWEQVSMGFVSAYLLYRDGEAALVDTGQPGAAPDIEAALSAIGLGWSDVGNVIVTHRHPDHAGSAEVIAALIPDAAFHIGTGDADALSSIEGVASVGTGDSVFDLDIIDTPGHTAGHICVLDQAAGILVTGDALTNQDGQLAGSSPQFTDDRDLADESVRTLAEFDYEVVLVGHGEPILEGGAAAVVALATDL